MCLSLALSSNTKSLISSLIRLYSVVFCVYCGQMEPRETAAASKLVSDRSIQVQLESFSEEELQQLRDEVKMLRIKCQRDSGLTVFFRALRCAMCVTCKRIRHCHVTC